MINMVLLISILQDSGAYDAGFKIGYFIGRLFPLIVIGIIGFFVYRYLKNKSNR